MENKKEFGRILTQMLEEAEKGNYLFAVYTPYRRRLRFKKQCKLKNTMFNLIKYYKYEEVK